MRTESGPVAYRPWRLAVSQEAGHSATSVSLHICLPPPSVASHHQLRLLPASRAGLAAPGTASGVISVIAAAPQPCPGVKSVFPGPLSECRVESRATYRAGVLRGVCCPATSGCHSTARAGRSHCGEAGGAVEVTADNRCSRVRSYLLRAEGGAGRRDLRGDRA